MKKVLILFGTRPEAIKLAPVIRALRARRGSIRTVVVSSAQHRDLLAPMVGYFRISVQRDLDVMTRGQTPSAVCARVLEAFDPVLAAEKPDLVLIQGDTSTALAGALAAFHRGIEVGHVEAGLRSGDPASPFPEEINRVLISRLASHHFAATRSNADNLRREGVPENRIFVTGNPVVDAVREVLRRGRISPGLRTVLRATEGSRRLVLTTHRRESFGTRMTRHLEILGEFLERHADVSLIFPVHPNPEVVRRARAVLGRRPRVRLIDPLGYPDFIALLSHSWAVVSDSGGVQEEIPELHRPLLVLRDNTERPEGVRAGFAKLVGADAERLAPMLDRLWRTRARPARAANPFGNGKSGEKIAALVGRILA